MMASNSSSRCSTPCMPDESAGSSVSTRLMEEYDELLKYAVVVPSYNPQELPKTISDLKGSFADMLRPVTENTDPAPNEADGDDTLSERSQDQLEQGREHVRFASDLLSTGTSSVAAAAGCTRHDFLATTESDKGTAAAVTECPPSTSGFAQFLSSRGASQLASTGFNHHRLDKTKTTSQQYTQQSHYMQHVLDNQDDDRESLNSYNNVEGEGGSELSSLVSYTPNLDSDLSRMDGLMDTWLAEVKKNVLNEFSASKIKQLQHAHRQMHKESQRHAAEKQQLYNEIESLKELLHTYEVSIERKDGVIANLTKAVQKQKDRQEMSKRFWEWKIIHNDQKREGFAANLADRHYQRTLMQKVWAGWHSVVEARWKSRVEKACQAKAAEVCMQLTNDYEVKLASAAEALESARSEVTKLHAEREAYEETMKKAFMRGVCALNMEAMEMFHQQNDSAPQQSLQPPGTAPNASEGHSSSGGGFPASSLGGFSTGGMMTSSGMTYLSQPNMTTEAPGAPVTNGNGVDPPPPVTHVHNHAAGTATTQSHARTKAANVHHKPASKGKVVTAKVTARSTPANRTASNAATALAPPMSSVIVQKHQPVVKQTIGHATAMKYPASYAKPEVTKHSHPHIGGQAPHTGVMPHVTPNIRTVKIVE